MSLSTQALSQLFAPPPSQNWTRRAYHGAVVAGDFVYIDAGEVAVGAEPWSYSIKGPNYTPLPINCTLTINIGQSWSDPSTVAFGAIPKPQAPIFDYSALWFDEQKNSIYSFGGEQSRLDTAVLDLSVWRLDLDGKGGGTWTQNATSKNAPFAQSVTRPFGGASTFTNNSAYYLGGASSSHSSPLLQTQAANVPLPGLVSYSFPNGAWSNSTTGITALSQSGSFEFGGIESVPFGPSGLLAVWGGETSNSSIYSAGIAERAISSVTLVDPVTKQWYQQNTTGIPPTPRSKFCYVGVSDPRPLSPANIGTYEIYMYGGYGGILGPGSQMYDELWVLSLPAFTWIQLDSSHKSARIGHTCHVVGNRQMLSIGGVDATQEDPWSTPDLTNWNGLGVFDMSAAKWTSGYDAGAAPYQRPQVVQSYYDKNGAFPNPWDQPALQSLFAKTPARPGSASPSTSAAPATATATAQSANHTAILVGAVVGGVGAVIIPLIIFLVYLRRHRRAQKPIISSPYPWEPAVAELSTFSRRNLRQTGEPKSMRQASNSSRASPPPGYCIEIHGGEIGGREVERREMMERPPGWDGHVEGGHRGLYPTEKGERLSGRERSPIEETLSPVSPEDRYHVW